MRHGLVAVVAAHFGQLSAWGLEVVDGGAVRGQPGSLDVWRIAIKPGKPFACQGIGEHGG